MLRCGQRHQRELLQSSIPREKVVVVVVVVTRQRVTLLDLVTPVFFIFFVNSAPLDISEFGRTQQNLFPMTINLFLNTVLGSGKYGKVIVKVNCQVAEE